MKRHFSRPCIAVPSIWRITAIGLLVGGGLLFGGACRRQAGQPGRRHGASELTIKGSDTMVHLVSAWAEAYMERHEETEISVTGGGSGTGFAALLNGTTDICAASRAMMPREQELARERDVTPRSYTVARDGIAIITHPSNVVDALSLEQLRKIYTGAYDQWSRVGGAEREMVVFSRDTSSGTYVYFQKHVLRKRDFRRDARLMPATSTIVQSVAEDQGAIGYVGLGYALGAGRRVKSLAISKSRDEKTIEPSIESVRSGRYSIARPLRFYTWGKPAGLAASFLQFCLSADGQSIVDETGYVVAE